MYCGKFSKSVQKTRSGKKHAMLIISLILLMTLAAGGTFAYLRAFAGTVENTFIPGNVNIQINERKTQNTKYNISVNNATVASKDAIPVYVRAKLVVCWTDVIDGQERVIPKPETASITIPAPINGWFCVGDTYYYPSVVNPGESTYVMVDQTNPITVTVPAGSAVKCYIDVQAEAIQADPESVVGQVWKDVTVVNGSLTAGSGGA